MSLAPSAKGGKCFFHPPPNLSWLTSDSPLPRQHPAFSSTGTTLRRGHSTPATHTDFCPKRLPFTGS